MRLRRTSKKSPASQSPGPGACNKVHLVRIGRSGAARWEDTPQAARAHGPREPVGCRGVRWCAAASGCRGVRCSVRRAGTSGSGAPGSGAPGSGAAGPAAPSLRAHPALPGPLLRCRQHPRAGLPPPLRRCRCRRCRWRRRPVYWGWGRRGATAFLSFATAATTAPLALTRMLCQCCGLQPARARHLCPVWSARRRACARAARLNSI